MEIALAKNLLSLLFEAPQSNAILVFEDNEYLGVILKRDIEYGIKIASFNLFENINMISKDNLDMVLFNGKSYKVAHIPVVDKTGNKIKMISMEEYNSIFNFDRFIDNFKESIVFDYLEHPIIITNYFKKIVYMNRRSLEISQKDYLSQKIGNFLKSFEIRIDQDKMIIEKDNQYYQLLITSSISKNFYYFVYMLIEYGKVHFY